jgi:2'-5' RNA ligase
MPVVATTGAKAQSRATLIGTRRDLMSWTSNSASASHIRAAHDRIGVQDDRVTDDTADTRPLVVTLQLESAAQARFDSERAELFPAGRTAVGAHVTLFHALPGHLREEVEDELDRQAAIATFTVSITEVFGLGRGVAYRLEAEEAQRLHQRLQDRWRRHLTRQDAQRFRPHVTVQNKVEPQVARATLQHLRSTFHPEVTRAVGIKLWRYDAGPWTLLREWQFDSAA